MDIKDEEEDLRWWSEIHNKILRVRDQRMFATTITLCISNKTKETSVSKSRDGRPHWLLYFLMLLIKPRCAVCMKLRKRNPWRISEDLKCKDKRACKWRIKLSASICVDDHWIYGRSGTYKFLNKYLWNEQNIICCYHSIFDTRVYMISCKHTR